MVKRPGPPSQGWRTFLRNHAPDIAAMDLFVVPSIGFNLLYNLHHRQAEPENTRLALRDNQSDRRMDRTTTLRGFPLARGPALRYSRSGSHLRHRRHPPFACHGYPGQAHRTGLALAEWLC